MKRSCYGHTIIGLFTFTYIIVCRVKLSSSFSITNQNAAVQNKDVETKIRQAMVLSNKGQQNISDAFLACSIWEDILKVPGVVRRTRHVNNPKMQSAEAIDEEQRQGTKNIIQISKQVRKICNVLYAASLVRIGRDSDAIVVHDETLALMDVSGGTIDNCTSNILEDIKDLSLWIDVKIAKGESLQRLMKYNLSRQEYKQVWKTYEHLLNDDNNDNTKEDFINLDFVGKMTQSAYKAALCSMRIDDLYGAKEILTMEYNRMKDESLLVGFDQCPNVVGFLGILEVELSQRNHESIKISSMEKLDFARRSSSASPIFTWFHALAVYAMKEDGSTTAANNIIRKVVQPKKLDLPILSNEYDLSNRDNLLKLSSINNLPFDDPFLIYLDDKVLLHNLLSTNKATKKFWPKGYILPDDTTTFQEDEKHSKKEVSWIIKKRAGYGSHGNSVASTNDVIAISSRLSLDEKVLCQKIIQPTLCKDRKRFSLRVYVVYFSPHTESPAMIFLSTKGLMKLALAEDMNLSNNNTSNESREGYNDIYMTNSGRISDTCSQSEAQFDFEYLKKFINETYGPGRYEKIWQSITTSVAQVIKLYLDDLKSSLNTRIPTTENHNEYDYKSIIAKVPKILGFDYIIDSKFNPWLLEVNRFPGLEARGEEDLQVKRELVEEVWKLAKVNYSDDSVETTHTQSIFQLLTIN